MEPLVIVIILLLGLLLVAFPLWALFQILALAKDNTALTQRLEGLTRQVHDLREDLRLGKFSVAETKPGAERAAPSAAAGIHPAEARAPIVTPLAPPNFASASASVAPAEAVRPAEPDAPRETPPLAPLPPPLPGSRRAGPTPGIPPLSSRPAVPSRPSAPPLPPFPAAPVRQGGGRINWEQFTGAKLLAYAGGLAAFLGAAFFLKYSFEHDLIPAEMRLTIGYVFALLLIGGGLKIPRPRYATTAQTLCATGVVSLYAVTFAGNSIYHFPFFGPLATFLLMTVVTAVAFLLAVRLEAQVVAVLGMLGGFLTPVLLWTGHNNPFGLFGYVALLDVGLIAVALHRRWHFLVPLGAAGTILMQFGWAARFLNAAEAPTAMVICLAFCGVFLAGYFVARAFAQRSRPFAGAAMALPAVALGFAAIFLGYGSIAARPGLLFAFVFAADLCLLAMAWTDRELPKLHLAAGLAVFGLLAGWTSARLTFDLLPWALGFYLLHAVLHTAFPLVLERRRPASGRAGWGQLFPPLALLLVAGPLFKFEALSLAFWPSVLLIDLLAIMLAFFIGSLIGVALVLVLTLGVTGLWLVRAPATLDAAGSMLLVIGGFAVLFFGASVFLTRRLSPEANASGRGGGGFSDPRAQLPAMSALLPFLLLIVMTQRLPLANPSPVFGMALLLVVLTLGLTALLALEWLPACGLAGVAALEYAWRARYGTAASPGTAVAWYLLFYAVFTVFPFGLRRRFAHHTGPWAVAALAGVVHFPLVYQLVQRTRPNDFMGVLPALFAVPPLVSLFVMRRATSSDARARLNQLAWFGGVALFFITLIFPIQFDRQWITVSWALEGAALLWLFGRVPHAGLRATGVVLLVAAFARLALNPAVLMYQPRSATPIFNWYLYSYGIVSACLFAGVRLLAPARERTLGLRARPLLGTLGTVLTFLLLNIEIADFFARPGQPFAFVFSGNFGRDMTHTIAWALFALGLLLVSFAKRLRAGRYAALALLGVALVKLFLHDLARLEALYRIGALFAVAAIAIVASFAYQRFLPSTEKSAREQA